MTCLKMMNRRRQKMPRFKSFNEALRAYNVKPLSYAPTSQDVETRMQALEDRFDIDITTLQDDSIVTDEGEGESK
jgi:hypothetical protein